MTDIPLGQIRPPRFKLRQDIGDLEELKLSMKERGLIQPISVRLVNGQYEVVAGHRRYVCATELAWETIRAEIISVTDAEAFEIALTENIQRKTMDVFEEARAFREYTEVHEWGSITELAKKIGKSHAYIIERISLLHLPRTTYHHIQSGKLSASHGEELARLTNEQANELTEAIIESKLDTNTTRLTVDYIKAGLGTEQAIQRALAIPEADITKTASKLNPVRVARESIVLSLTKCLKEIDFHLQYVPEGEEQAGWIHAVRAPLHDLIDKAIKVRRQYGK